MRVRVELELPDTPGPPSPQLRALEALTLAGRQVYEVEGQKGASVVQIELTNRGERVGKVTVER